MMQENLQGEWASLAKKRIYFGHQSVGYNIIDGINDLKNEDQSLRVNIKETTDPSVLAGPVFAHSRIGRNEEPASKCDEFRKNIDNGMGSRIDVAGFKFCYIDFNRDSVIENIMRHYSETMEYLEKKYPDVKFIHFTVPLRTIPEGIKSGMRRLLGRSIPADEDNMKRNEFNQLLLERYGGTGRVFDLAKYESTKPDGERCSFDRDGRQYCSLFAGYSNDGGHLNEAGRKHIARNFLAFLQKL